jgi:hypothetical protein
MSNLPPQVRHYPPAACQPASVTFRFQPPLQFRLIALLLVRRIRPRQHNLVLETNFFLFIARRLSA